MGCSLEGSRSAPVFQRRPVAVQRMKEYGEGYGGIQARRRHCVQSGRGAAQVAHGPPQASLRGCNSFNAPSADCPDSARQTTRRGTRQSRTPCWSSFVRRCCLLERRRSSFRSAARLSTCHSSHRRGESRAASPAAPPSVPVAAHAPSVRADTRLSASTARWRRWSRPSQSTAARSWGRPPRAASSPARSLREAQRSSLSSGISSP